MSAEAVVAATPSDTGSVRRTLILVAVATLPFTYAITVDLSFPLKIYEVVLALVLLTYLLDLRLPLAPGAIAPVRRLAWFAVAAGVLTLVRFAIPAEGAAVGYFGVRFGPIGDAVAKLLYLTLGLLGLLLFTHSAYENESRYLRAWRLGATVAAVYSWYLFVAGLLGLEPFVLPGIVEPKYFTVAGRSFVRSGTFNEGNILGLFMLLSVGLALYERRRLVAVLFSLTVLLTFSTVNVAGLALLWTMVWYREHSNLSVGRRVLYLGLGAVVLLAVGFALWQAGYLQAVIVGKLSGDELGSKVKRIAFVIAGLRMFSDHPLLGVGISQFGYFYNSYQTLGIWGIAETVKLIPNNIYVELLSELGIIGFLIFTSFLLLVYRRLRYPELTPLRLTFITMLLVWNAFPTYTMMFLWAFLGLAVGASSRLTSVPRPPSGA
jgi:O-antigen ligase